MWRKVFGALATTLLGAGIVVSAARVANADSPPACGARACSDEVALSGLTGMNRASCSKAVQSACNAGTCSCGSSFSVCGSCGDMIGSLCGSLGGASGSCPRTTTTSTSTTTTTTATTTTTTTTTTQPQACFPTSGQKTCWDSSGTVIQCAGTGQDGDLQKGAPLSYTDNGDGTITDNNTGLTWEKLSQDGSVHDVHNTYTWDNAFSVHVAMLNSTNFGGHSDWRLPNVKELESIVNYENVNPSMSAAFNTGCASGCTVLTCSCTVADYWSSTTDASGSPTAWIMNFTNGFTFSFSKEGDIGFSVRAVRGGSLCLPATGQTTCWDSSGNVISCAGTGQDGDIQAGAPLSYTDNGDGTITDNDTGLTWEKQSQDGSIHDVHNIYTWDNAFSVHVAMLNSTNFAGHSDWRLPNVKELESIVNYENVNPSMSAAFNTGCMPGCTVLTCSCTVSDYWSSTTNAGGTFAAWLVNFTTSGFVYNAGKEGNIGSVRAVRGGS